MVTLKEYLNGWACCGNSYVEDIVKNALEMYKKEQRERDSIVLQASDAITESIKLRNELGLMEQVESQRNGLLSENEALRALYEIAKLDTARLKTQIAEWADKWHRLAVYWIPDQATVGRERFIEMLDYACNLADEMRKVAEE